MLCHSKRRAPNHQIFRFALAPRAAVALCVCMLVNGVETDAEQGLLALLAKLGIEPSTVAVLINGDILPRKDWAERELLPADEVEIVKFVGGG
jgi:sulfur carrier protein